MRLQDLSYIPRNDVFSFLSFPSSLEVFSLENLYTLEPGSLQRTPDGSLVSSSLIYGDEVPVKGRAGLTIEGGEKKATAVLFASLDQKIRSLKLRLHELPEGEVVSLVGGAEKIDAKGRLFRYPEGWRSLSWPLLVLRLGQGKYLYFRVLEREVQPVSFYLKKEGKGLRLDITVEEIASRSTSKVILPPIEGGYASSLHEIAAKEADFVEKTYGLEKYPGAAHAPSWLKGIDLVVTMHMEAFTGKIFHTYESALLDLKRLASLIDPKRVLVYLPGWEGRYYYKYGDYTPDPRLGGEEGLKKMVEGMHGLGAKVMAMYGMNMADVRLKEVADLRDECEFITPSGGLLRQGSVDWEGGHHYDFGGLANLNVAHAKWQDYLYEQIRKATLAYGFDGAFLDIAACYTNDPRAELSQGVKVLCQRLRTIKEDFLVSGEGYYDALGAAMPLFQSGHTDGILHYHDSVDESLFTPYAREFAHLCLGDAGSFSTGVHEQGHTPDWRMPVRKGLIPTLSLVGDSLDLGLERVKAIVEDADAYRRLQDE